MRYLIQSLVVFLYVYLYVSFYSPWLDKKLGLVRLSRLERRVSPYLIRVFFIDCVITYIDYLHLK